LKKTNNKGGRREGSGRPSFFRGKTHSAEDPLYTTVSPPQTILLTRTGLKSLKRVEKRLTKEYQVRTGNKKARVSRSVVVEALGRIYGEKLTLDQIIREDAR